MDVLDGVTVRKYTDLDAPFVYELKKMHTKNMWKHVGAHG